MGIKYAVNENFFKKWSPKMAYILGFLYADGSMEDASYLRGKYVRVSSTDKENITRIKKTLDSKHTIVEYPPLNKERKRRYLLRIGSHKLYNDLTKLGLFPKKSLTMKFPNVPKKFISFFILGYFDGDGCVTIERSKKENVKRLRTVFTAGSKIFLETLSIKLREYSNTSHRKVYNGHRSYMLCYSTEDSIKLFKFFYRHKNKDFSLARKIKVFLEYLKLKPERVDKSINSIVVYFSSGRVVK